MTVVITDKTNKEMNTQSTNSETSVNLADYSVNAEGVTEQVENLATQAELLEKIFSGSPSEENFNKGVELSSADLQTLMYGNKK